VKRLSLASISGTFLTVDVPSIATNTIETLDLSAGDAELLGINTIGIVVKAAQGKFRYYVEPLASRPVAITTDPSGVLYRLIEITTENISASNVKAVEISIEVNKTWVTANNIDANAVALYRFTTAWDKLTTTKTSEDSGKYYYKATSPGFSTFAIAGDIVTVQPSAQTGTGAGAGTAGTGAGTAGTGASPIPPEVLYPVLGVIIVGVLLVVGIKFVIPRWRERRISYKYKKAKTK
jgi:PGF-pre-PGF domain-containing protein